jgi:WD40 repeat protein
MSTEDCNLLLSTHINAEKVGRWMMENCVELNTGLRLHNMALTSDNAYFLVVTSRGELALISRTEGKIEKFFKIPSYVSLDGLALDQKNEYFYVSGSDKLIRKCNLSTFTQTELIRGNGEIAYRVRMSNDQKYLYSISLDSTVREWDLQNLGNFRLLYSHSRGCNSIDISFDGNYIITCGHDAKIKIYNLSTKHMIKVIKIHKDLLSWCVKISKSNNYVASGGRDGIANIWKFGDWDNKLQLIGHESVVSYFEFTPDERYFLTGSLDTTIKIWRIPSGDLITTLNGHKSGIYKILIPADEAVFYSASEEGRIFTWKFPIIA